MWICIRDVCLYLYRTRPFRNHIRIKIWWIMVPNTVVCKSDQINIPASIFHSRIRSINHSHHPFLPSHILPVSHLSNFEIRAAKHYLAYHNGRTGEWLAVYLFFFNHNRSNNSCLFKHVQSPINSPYGINPLCIKSIMGLVIYLIWDWVRTNKI